MKKRVTRDEEQAVVAGVLAGLAKYFDHDPVLYRLIAITFLILTGVFPGLIIYLVGWFVMPKDNTVKVDYEVVE